MMITSMGTQETRDFLLDASRSGLGWLVEIEIVSPLIKVIGKADFYGPYVA